MPSIYVFINFRKYTLLANKMTPFSLKKMIVTFLKEKRET